MKVPPPKALSFLSLLGLLVGIAHAWESENANTTAPYSEVFPSLHNVVSMARLSHLVYAFKSEKNFTCDEFPLDRKNESQGLSCELYIHDYTLGTQVLLVSNEKEKYIAVVFAGTDNIRTSLENLNLFYQRFGNNSTVRLTNETYEQYESAKVHGGFNNAVFTHGIWEQIYSKTQELLRKYPSYSLWTTGHSLGGANSILAATAFASLNRNRTVLNVNFGCPQTGNWYWKDFFDSTSPLTNNFNGNLGIWRVVLGWDLVPRLPQFFYHVGHTIQIDDKTNDVKVYYEHYGDQERGYAGVPDGWYSKSYAWLPYALHYHHMPKYVESLEGIGPESWTETFFGTNSSVYDDEMNDNPSIDRLAPEDETRLPNAGEEKSRLRKAVQ